MSTNNFRSQCGSELKTGANYCPYCGRPVNSPPSPVGTSQPTNHVANPPTQPAATIGKGKRTLGEKIGLVVFSFIALGLLGNILGYMIRRSDGPNSVAEEDTKTTQDIGNYGNETNPTDDPAAKQVDLAIKMLNDGKSGLATEYLKRAKAYPQTPLAIAKLNEYSRHLFAKQSTLDMQNEGTNVTFTAEGTNADTLVVKYRNSDHRAKRDALGLLNDANAARDLKSIGFKKLIVTDGAIESSTRNL